MSQNNTASLDSANVGMRLIEMISSAKQMRVKWERTWYDNSFFDDGFHFRYVSRSTGRIIDKTNSSNSPNKMRAIPKASKQIRGIANLLVGTNPHPVVYPDRVLASNFQGNSEAYEAAKKWAKESAKKIGHWLNEELVSDDFEDKLTEMVILSAKESVSYLKIVPDPIKEDLISVVRDAFDVYLVPTSKSEDDSPFMAESCSVQVQEVWNNELYDERVRMSVTPDNKFSGSQIKDSYLRDRFGTALQGQNTGTATINEGYIREFLNEDNYDRISQQEDADIVLAGKKMGDPIIRQVVCTIGGATLYDHYTTLTMYPYAAFRFEPGYMYQVSQIERFIPANKSLDAVVSRLEGYLHTMVTGIWAKRKGEGFKITNQYGGQVVEYDNAPPQSIPVASPPAFVFQFIGLLNSLIEEQGLSANTLGQIPSGVKAFKAIESLKEGELNNLQIPLKQLKKTVNRVAQIYMQYADDFFTQPRPVIDDEAGEPTYFDVIGKRAFDVRESLGVSNEGMVPINKKAPVKIEVENGAAFTEEGRKGQMLDLITTLMPLFESQALPPEFLKKMALELTETFKVGSMQEMMDVLETMPIQEEMTENDIEKVKVAMLEVMRDTAGGPEPEQLPPEGAENVPQM